MRRYLPLLIALMVFVSFLPNVSAQFGRLTTAATITVVKGDYAQGEIILKNEAPLAYSLISYQRFWVEDGLGREVGGFNLTISPRVFSSWKSGEEKRIAYRLTCSGNVTPGNYTLHLRFLGKSGGQVVIVRADVPLMVLASPLIFKGAETYIPGRGQFSYAFVGEKVVVYSHVLNIGHKNVTVTASVSLERGGKRYYSKTEHIRVSPGDSLIKFTVPIGLHYPEGSYTLKYSLSGGGGSYSFTKNFTVLVGVKLAGISLQKERVKLNEKNGLYVTILSERKAKVRLEVEVFRGNESVGESSKELNLSPGTGVFELPLPTNVGGNLTAHVRLFLGDRLVGSSEVKYQVIAPPEIVGIKADYSDGRLSFVLSIFNPGDTVEAMLSHRISEGGKTLYEDSIVNKIPPGNSTLKMVFQIPPGNVSYSFALKANGHVSTINGSVRATTPAPTSSTTSTTSPRPPRTSTTSSTEKRAEGGKSSTWIALILLLLVVAFLAGVWYYGRRGEKYKRPRPKRRSPLGRFRKPRIPKFRERDSLPKKR